jgi:hypothetical protein
MKLKWIPLSVTAALSAALLFGGWTAYQRYGVEQPLERIAASVPGVDAVQSEISPGQVVLKAELKPDADLAQIYREIQQKAARAIGGRTLEIEPVNRSDARLDKAWSRALFDVAEAMEHRRYSDVVAAMNRLQRQNPGVQADTSMDEQNVYIRLTDHSAVKFVVLPRQPDKLGVWPNA